MSNSGFQPKGRGALPKELLQFGTHLVYSEGTRTEPHYVENIKKNIADKYSRNPNEIKIISGTKEKTYHTVDLVKYAIKDVKKRLDEGNTVNHVWIFFDKDNFTDFYKAHELINKQNNSKCYNDDGFLFNKKTGISWHSCWSNQCFELWLCLYFNYYCVQHNREEYKYHLEKSTPLKKIQFEYDKNLENIHNILTENGGSINNAIKYAKKLERENKIEDPSTGVYLFAEYFKNYMKN